MKRSTSLHAGMRRVAEPHRDLALDVEGEPLLGAAGDEMHVAAHRPEEILGAAEHLVFLAVEHAALDQLLGLAHAVDVFGDPEQRVQIAQAALAVLHVRLDQIARLAGAAQPLLALGELGGDELRARCPARCSCRSARRTRRTARGRRAGSAPPAARCGWSCRPWPGGCTRRPSASRGRPSAPCPTGNRECLRRPTRPTRSACRAAGTTDRCRSPAQAGRGRSRRSPPPPCARCPTAPRSDRACRRARRACG